MQHSQATSFLLFGTFCSLLFWTLNDPSFLQELTEVQEGQLSGNQQGFQREEFLGRTSLIEHTFVDFDVVPRLLDEDLTQATTTTTASTSATDTTTSTTAATDTTTATTATSTTLGITTTTTETTTATTTATTSATTTGTATITTTSTSSTTEETTSTSRTISTTTTSSSITATTMTTTTVTITTTPTTTTNLITSTTSTSTLSTTAATNTITTTTTTTSIATTTMTTTSASTATTTTTAASTATAAANVSTITNFTSTDTSTSISAGTSTSSTRTTTIPATTTTSTKTTAITSTTTTSTTQSTAATPTSNGTTAMPSSIVSTTKDASITTQTSSTQASTATSTTSSKQITASTTAVKQRITGTFTMLVSDVALVNDTNATKAVQEAIAKQVEVAAEDVTVKLSPALRRLAAYPRELTSADVQVTYTIQVSVVNATSVQKALLAVGENSQPFLTILASYIGNTYRVDQIKSVQVDGVKTTTTSTTTTTTTPINEAAPPKEESNDAVIIGIVVGVLGSLLLFGVPFLASYARQRLSREQFKNAARLSFLAEEFEQNLQQISQQVEVYDAKFSSASMNKASQLWQVCGENHASFMNRWEGFNLKAKEFLEHEYTPEMEKRKQQLPTLPSDAATASRPLGKASRPLQPPCELNDAKEPLKARRSVITKFWPPLPATRASEVKSQQQVLEKLEEEMIAISKDFILTVEAAFPGGIKELPTPGQFQMESSWNRSADTEVHLLGQMSHPLLSRFSVKSYNLFGKESGQKDPEPLKPVDAVIVDSASWPHIGRRNDARSATGTSSTIYDWLELKRPPALGKFPPEVHQKFRTAREEDAEMRAKYYYYGEGQNVIHVVPPKVTDHQAAIHDLSRTYADIFDEFCGAITEPPTPPGAASKAPRRLRLAPVSTGTFLLNKKLDTHMAQLTWSSVALALGMIPISLQEKLMNAEIEVCVAQSKHFASYKDILRQKLSLVSGDKFQLGHNFGQVPQKYGSFDWVRTKNGPADRFERLASFLRTASAISSSGYLLPNGQPIQLHLVEMLSGTRVTRALEAGTKSEDCKKKVRHEDATVMEAAIACQLRGKQTVAVNAASAYQVGGGVMTGGRHALEEAWCTMSTVLPSLQIVQWQERLASEEALPVASVGSSSSNPVVEASGHVVHQHIPVDACIVSPHVEIFRETSNKGYAFQSAPTKLAGVCSMAMFNMNPRVSDSPLDAPSDFVTYCRQVKQKFRAVLSATKELEAEVLVCPDVGCGVFENDPEVVGSLLGEAIREYPKDLEIVVTGKPAFARAVEIAASALSSDLLRESRPAPPSFYRGSPGSRPRAAEGTSHPPPVYIGRTESPVPGRVEVAARPSGIAVESHVQPPHATVHGVVVGVASKEAAPQLSSDIRVEPIGTE